MAGHLASDLAFSPPPGGGGDGPGGPEPGWVDPRTWLGFQGPPGGPAVGPGLAPGTEVWGIAPCPPPYEFCGGMAYCGPQAGVGLAPQGGLEAPQLEGEAGAGVESNSEGASPEPCAALPGALKLEQEKLEPGAEEEVSGAGARGAGGRQGRPGRRRPAAFLAWNPRGAAGPGGTEFRRSRREAGPVASGSRKLAQDGLASRLAFLPSVSLPLARPDRGLATRLITAQRPTQLGV